MTFIAFFSILLLTVSAHTESVYEAAEGYQAPLFKLDESYASLEGNFDLADMQGHYVLLSFWSSADASSRIAVADYDRMARSVDEGLMCRVSVNMDSNSALFQEIVRHDSMRERMHFRASGDKAVGLTKLYHLDKGYRTMLIDPTGRIVAVNPSSIQLTEILN